MKTITPMTRLKDIMNVIKEKLDIKDGFHIFELNQKDSKEKYYGCYDHIVSKPVKSEFILIFQNLKNKEESFAFAYNNIHLDIKDVLITVSIKKRNDIISSTISFEEFKTKLKLFRDSIPTLKEEDKAKGKLIKVAFKLIEEIFSLKTFKEEEKENLISSLKEKYKKDLNYIQRVKKEVLELENNDFKRELETFKSIVEESKEFKEVMKIKKQMASLQEKLKVAKVKLDLFSKENMIDIANVQIKIQEKKEKVTQREQKIINEIQNEVITIPVPKKSLIEKIMNS